MKQLIYVSFLADGEQSSNVISDIKNVSCKNNNELGITGLLVYNSSIFLQLLEGPEKDVDLLYTKIKHDKRHSDIKILLEQDVPGNKRAFDEWDMKFQLIDNLNLDAINVVLSFSSHQKTGIVNDVISSSELRDKFDALTKKLLDSY